MGHTSESSHGQVTEYDVCAVECIQTPLLYDAENQLKNESHLGPPDHPLAAVHKEHAHLPA